MSFEIFITDMDLPNLESPWTEVELGNAKYSFKRSTKEYKTFNVSGYIEKENMEATRVEAEGLNTSLLENPSGVIVDGFGNSYECYVNSWNIKPVAGVNKYTFTFNCRLVN